jgi:phosphomannomutase
VEKIGSFPVENRVTTDGYKFRLPGGEWVAFRAGGTEPVFRCCIKDCSRKSLAPLRQAFEALLG